MTPVVSTLDIETGFIKHRYSFFVFQCFYSVQATAFTQQKYPAEALAGEADLMAKLSHVISATRWS